MLIYLFKKFGKYIYIIIFMLVILYFWDFQF
ncbi:uncharacterized protein METZ01_LOCUS353158 [marine metagenome]|uniref:Uncharacterized protein n=1 Tax=marine metagenome TaxID=408172 RepID=A0A382RRJ1_9ZZZZ